VDKKLIDCYWFLQDQCKKGDACEYRHSQAAHDTQTVCKFWQQNQCTNQSCKFRHPSGNKALCMFFAQGACNKGDACPYLHTAPVDPQLVEKKKKEEDELRRVQAERKKEEDRLAKLKAQREQLEKPPKQAAVGGKPVRERKVAVGGTFQRTVGDIVKGAAAQDKQKLSTKPQKLKVEGGKKDKPTKVVPKMVKPQEPSGPVSFGVKSLDQIMKEKTVAPNGEDPPKATPLQQPASTVQSKDSTYLEELRKKNQQKFSPSSQSQKTEQPTKGNPQKTGVPAISPKRQLAEEPTQVEQKRQRTEQSPSLSKSEETSDVVEIELDEDTLALQELLG
jgi:hypothetical protein